MKAIYLTTFGNREHREEAEEISLIAKMTTETRTCPPASPKKSALQLHHDNCNSTTMCYYLVSATIPSLISFDLFFNYLY